MSSFCVGNSRVSKRACYWQLSPSPWAGGAACCVGRGYTCSGPVRPRYRCTSRLRPAPSCRSASPPLGWGIEPVESERIRVLLGTSTGTGCLCILLFIVVATQQDLLKLWCRQDSLLWHQASKHFLTIYTIMWFAVPVLSVLVSSSVIHSILVLLSKVRSLGVQLNWCLFRVDVVLWLIQSTVVRVHMRSQTHTELNKAIHSFILRLSTYTQHRKQHLLNPIS